MKIGRKIIIGPAEDPLMVLEKYKTIANCDFDSAENELVECAKKTTDKSYTWGYFPELNPKEEDYAYCARLANQLQTNFINNLDSFEKNFKLAFIRVATKTPVSEFGGLHIDVDVGIGHKRPSGTKEKEIVRLLVNFGQFPRTLEYAEIGRDELKNIGVDISEDKYDVLKLPKNIEIKKIKIPPRNGEFIWGLKFWSSLIPHFGVTNNNGHFLAAYGMFASRNEYKL